MKKPQLIAGAALAAVLVLLLVGSAARNTTWVGFFVGDGSGLTNVTSTAISTNQNALYATNGPDGVNLLANLKTNDTRNAVLTSSTNNLGIDVSATRFWGDGSHLTGVSGTGSSNITDSGYIAVVRNENVNTNLGAQNAFVTNIFNLASASANTVVGTDGGKNIVSYAAGSGISISGGTISSTAQGMAVPFTNATYAYADIFRTNKLAELTNAWGVGEFDSVNQTNYFSGNLSVSGTSSFSNSVTISGGPPGLMSYMGSITASNGTAASASYSQLNTNGTVVGTSNIIAGFGATFIGGNVNVTNASTMADITDSQLSANLLVGTDSGKKLVSYSSGYGTVVSGGAVTFDGTITITNTIVTTNLTANGITNTGVKGAVLLGTDANGKEISQTGTITNTIITTNLTANGITNTGVKGAVLIGTDANGLEFSQTGTLTNTIVTTNLTSNGITNTGVKGASSLATDANGLIIAGSGGGGTAAGAWIPNLGYEVFYETFGTGAKAASGSIGTLGWQTATVGSGTSEACVGTAGHFGVFQMGTGASQPGSGVVILLCDTPTTGNSPFPPLNNTTGWTNTFVWKLSATNDIRLYAGLASEGSFSLSSGQNDPTGFIGIKADSTNSVNFQHICRTSSTSTILTSVGLDTNWHTNRVYCTVAGTISFDMDGANVQTSNSNVPTANLGPIFMIVRNLGATTPAVNLLCDTYLGVFTRQ